MLVAVCVSLLSSCQSPEQESGLAYLNWDRGSNGRYVLPVHRELQVKAQAWAEKIARDNALSHSDLAAGVSSCWRGLAENVGYGASIQAVEQGYMGSTPHRTNILNPAWDRAAVGVGHNGSRVFTVQVFMDGC